MTDVLRITKPQDCAGIFCTTEAFNGLQGEIRERLVHETVGRFMPEYERSPLYSGPTALSVALLYRLVVSRPVQLGYLANGALRRALMEVST